MDLRKIRPEANIISTTRLGTTIEPCCPDSMFFNSYRTNLLPEIAFIRMDCHIGNPDVHHED